MTHWSTKYIGTPFSDSGDGPDSFDCWGFAVHVMKQEFHVDLPELEYAFNDMVACKQLADKHSAEYPEIPGPVEGAVVLWHFERLRPHVGICLNDREVLHMHRASGAVITPLTSGLIRNGIVGYYLPNRISA